MAREPLAVHAPGRRSSRSLCVDIELAPLSRQETAERYGFSVEAWRVEDSAWKKWIADEPGLRTDFERARAVYRQWRGA